MEPLVPSREALATSSTTCSIQTSRNSGHSPSSPTRISHALRASVAIAETRAWSTSAAPRCFCAKRSVALRPEPAAVGLGTVAVMVVLLRRCGPVVVEPRSSVLAGAGELVEVDVDADPRPGTDDELAAGDLQRFGEQVVAHVQEVGELAGPAGRAAVGGAEGHGAGGTDLAVDLVAHDDLDAEALALVQDALRGAEAGAGGLDADGGRRAAEQLAGDLTGRGGALVGDGRHRRL